MKNSDFVKGWLLGATGVLILVISEINSIWSTIPESQQIPLLIFGMLLFLPSLYYYYKAYQSME